jgi:ABC-type lipoprotein export system ATPase subunit
VTDGQKSPKKTIISGISGHVKGGEFLTIFGRSGSGKTTLMNFLRGEGNSENLVHEGGDVYINR